MPVSFTPSPPLISNCRSGAVAEGVKSGEVELTAVGMGGSDDLPLPPALQSFLNRLPPHTGQEPDIDQYLRRFKNLVLPPRPIAETEGDGDMLLVGVERCTR